MSETITPREIPIISVEDAMVHFPVKRSQIQRLQGKPKQFVQALNGVRLEITRGETLGIVGESGCGKSTLARTLVGLLSATDGRVRFKGQDIATLVGQARRSFNRQVQMIFQDPYGSLNPRMTVGHLYCQPWFRWSCYPATVHRRSRRRLVNVPEVGPDR